MGLMIQYVSVLGLAPEDSLRHRRPPTRVPKVFIFDAAVERPERAEKGD